MDRLTGQLNFLPSIIGKMGLSIAEAQKEFNADYVTNVAKLLGLISRTLPKAQDASGATAGAAQGGDADQRLTAVWDLLKSLAPPRYQFTETTIEFRADLAESKDVNVQAGVGVGMYGVTVNAGLTLGFGYDYRSAAQITAVIHAREAGSGLADALLARAKEIDASQLDLPSLSTVEKDQWDATANIVNALFALENDKAVKPVDAKKPAVVGRRPTVDRRRLAVGIGPRWPSVRRFSNRDLWPFIMAVGPSVAGVHSR